MPSSVSGSGGNIPEIKVHASLDKDKDAKVVYSEAESSAKSNSVFTNNTSQAKVQTLINQNAAGKFSSVDATVTSTVTKYLGGTSLSQMFESALQSSFQAIGYDVKTVASNESANGHNGTGGTDASGGQIAGSTQGYQQAIDSGIQSKITAQLNTISNQVVNQYTTKLNSAINQARNELSNDRSQAITGGSGNNPNMNGAEIDTSKDAAGTVHTYDSAAGGKNKVGSAGYEATMSALKGKGGKIKTAFVDGKEVQIIKYKDENGNKRTVVVDDEGNTHDLQQTKGSSSYLTAEGLASMREATGDTNLKAKDIKVKQRKVTDADTGVQEKQSVATVKKKGDGKHTYQLHNNPQGAGGHVDNQVTVNEAVKSKGGLFRKNQYVSGDSVGTIMRDGGKAVKHNGERTIQTREGDFVGVKDNAKIQSTAQDLREQDDLAQFKSDAAKAGYNVQVVGGKIQLVSFSNGKMQMQQFNSLQDAKNAFNNIQNDKGSVSRHVANDDVKTDIREQIPSDFSNNGGVKISPKAKNVKFNRSEWNHNWAKDANKVQQFQNNAHSVEDVFNIMLSQNGLDASKFKFNDSIRNLLIKNNPSIFDNNGHVYNGASFAQRLDLPSEKVLKQMCSA